MKTTETIHTPETCNAALTAMGDAMYVLGGKWKLRIILSIRNGNKRFNEIQRSIEGLSAKVLSNELKDMETNGLIKRNVYTETPVVIEYVVTDYCDTLEPVLDALVNWGREHRNKIREGSF